MTDFAKVSEVKKGTILIANGFSCIKEGTALEVKADIEGDLFVECSGGTGKHWLAGQEHQGVYLGFSIQKDAEKSVTLAKSGQHHISIRLILNEADFARMTAGLGPFTVEITDTDGATILRARGLIMEPA